MKELIIVTDHDGTFSKIKPLLKNLGIIPYVITGRSKDELPQIKNQLNGIPIKGLYCYPYKYCGDLEKHLERVYLWKAKMVKKLKADYFIDDDHRVLNAVHYYCPKVVIIEISGGLK